MASGQGALRRPHTVDAVESSRCGWPHTGDRGLLLKLGGSLPLYSRSEGVVVGQLDPDRQVELDELLAALAATESLPLDDPVSMYLREVASLDPLPLGREGELLIAIRRGDESARHRLTEFNLWGVVRLARPFIGRGVSFLDLVQEGNLGLIRAVSEVPSEQQSFNQRRDAWVREAIERAFG